MAPELVGTSETGIGVSGESTQGEGVRGASREGAGVVGSGSPAGRFSGNVEVDGTVNTTHVSAEGNISARGNINGGNVNVADAVNAARVVLSKTVHFSDEHGAGAGLLTSVLECNDADTLTLGHLSAGGNVSAVGNVNAGATVSTIHVSAQGNISAAGNINAGKTLNTTHVRAQGNISALGNVNARDMNVTGDIKLVNADCAEEFDVEATCAQEVAPGTVVILGDDGCIGRSRSAYDKRVAGVVSGAANYRPGIILDRAKGKSDRLPVALLGKVFCNVDARYGPVETGDLLTTSDTPGHAMKATDPSRAFGAVIGKALRPLREGQALVPILVALQ